MRPPLPLMIPSVLALIVVVVVGAALANADADADPNANDNAKGRRDVALTLCDNDGIACGFVDVPIDPDDPHSATLQIAIKMHRAPEAERTGTLFVNLGGPEESLSSFAWFYKKLPEPIRRHFDVVTFDRRGGGQGS